ncbi:hypothetical protein QFZ68_006175 [Streptomyces sp. V1I6]|nr:hypothetical protein [Streptomyces sp. V1I6]
MKIQVPEGATEVKGAVQVNPQEDSYILTFRTDSATAARIAKDLRSEDPPAPWKSSFSPKRELFRHLGLAEPQTLKAPSGQASVRHVWRTIGDAKSHGWTSTSRT